MATAAIAPFPRDLKPGTKEAEPAQWVLVLPADKAPEKFLRVSTTSKRTSSMPREILFGALQSPALRMVKPIRLRAEKTKDAFSVVWDETSEFGYGDTLSEAIFDFSATVAELFLALSEQESLSDDLVEVKNKLSEYIELRPR